jgi:hypothetical protein
MLREACMYNDHPCHRWRSRQYTRREEQERVTRTPLDALRHVGPEHPGEDGRILYVSFKMSSYESEALSRKRRDYSRE